MPLARWIDARCALADGTPWLLGISGAQGTGKSTLAGLLGDVLHLGHGRRAAVLSLDDFYLPRDERAVLADRVHPLLATRGVPGTHDLGLLNRTLDAALALRQGATLCLPRFDKGRDDRADESAWPVLAGPFDVVMLEGWCIGADAQPAAALAEPVNALEAAGDPDGRWRGYVNDCLAGAYRELFARLQALVFLRAPGLEAVRRWRTRQEHALATRSDAPRAMSDAAVRRFIQHFERLSRHCLQTLPGRADAVLALREDHGVASLRFCER